MNRTRRFCRVIVGIALPGALLFLMSMPGCTESPDGIAVESPAAISGGLAKASNGMVGVNIVLNIAVTDPVVRELGSFGSVLDVYYEINALRILAKAEVIPAIQALPYVKAAGLDAERDGPPIDAVPVANFANGLSTWDLDAINVTNPGYNNRQGKAAHDSRELCSKGAGQPGWELDRLHRI